MCCLCDGEGKGVKQLISWIGRNDLNALGHKEMGPIASTLLAEGFDSVHLLYNYPLKEVKPYLKWLSKQTTTSISAQKVKLRSPIHYGDIYQAADIALSDLSSTSDEALSILISPGTPAMQSIWILLGKTKYPSTFYQSSIEAGVEKVEIPFDISAEFLPAVAEQQAKYLSRVVEVPINAAFDNIITQSAVMKTLKAQATTLAAWEEPVLIYGETGTGKELFATAIHNASARRAKPIKTLNCGAIPDELIDSTLFGHVKGAFTGATSDHKGYFEEADGGTLFLDEFAELSKGAQVRLLRVLQNGEFSKVGSTKPVKVNVRLIAATNVNLMEAIAAGDFREDLFYRVAIGVLHLPPLRERAGDIGLLCSTLLEQINQQMTAISAQKHKIFSAKAKNIILKHRWPGNVRELYSTLLRACIWSADDQISDASLTSVMFKTPTKAPDILTKPFDKNFNIQKVVDELVRSYVEKALLETTGNKTQAAALLGLGSYQTLSNWIEKHKIT
jgi:transcriptional regulator with PAS, ATPase and Fis domain